MAKTTFIVRTPRLHSALTKLVNGIGTTHISQRAPEHEPQALMPSKPQFRSAIVAVTETATDGYGAAGGKPIIANVNGTYSIVTDGEIVGLIAMYI